MKIVDIHEASLPISSPIRNAVVDFTTMDCSVVAVVTDQLREGRPLVGYGFTSNGRYSSGGIIRRRLVPRLLDADPTSLLDGSGVVDPHRAWETMMRNEKPGGHGERSTAVGAVDMALWDLAAKAYDEPLHRHLARVVAGGREPDPDVFVYAAGGYYGPGKTTADLANEIRVFLDAGYQVVKIKIGGAELAEDLRRIEAVIDVLGGNGGRLAVDANGRFDLQRGLAYAKALAPYGLFWFEEPGDPLDYRLHAALAEHYPGPMATGENLFSHPDARNLLRHAGMRADRDWLQFDPALSYGLVEYQRILGEMNVHGWSPRRCIPHGGHQFSLHVASALGLGGNEAYPGVFQPAGGYADGAEVVDSRVAPTDAPGVGFELKSDLYTVMRALHT